MPKTKSEMVVKSRRKRRQLDRALEVLTAVCDEVAATGDTPVVTHIDRRDGLRLDWQFHPVVYEVMQSEAAAMKLSVDEFMQAVMKSRQALGEIAALKGQATSKSPAVRKLNDNLRRKLTKLTADGETPFSAVDSGSGKVEYWFHPDIRSEINQAATNLGMTADDLGAALAMLNNLEWQALQDTQGKMN